MKLEYGRRWECTVVVRECKGGGGVRWLPNVYRRIYTIKDATCDGRVPA
jgi:hypothetical protein